MPLDGDDYDYREEVDNLHCHTLTGEQWQVVELIAHSMTLTQIAQRLGRHATTVGKVRQRAANRIFRNSALEPSDAALAVFFYRHEPCCRESA